MLARMWGKRNPHMLTLWRLLTKLSIDLPYDPAIPYLGTYPKECNLNCNKNTCTPMFTAAIIYNSEAMETAKMPPN
jgi:hypothetical protein